MRRFAPPIVGLVILSIVLWRSDIGQLTAILANVNLVLVAAAALVLPVSITVQAWRWYALVRGQRIEYGLLDCVLVYWAGQAAGIVTPGRLGDLVKVLYIRNHGHSTGGSLVSVILDRLFDLAFLLLVGLLGSLMVWGMPVHPAWWIVPSCAAALAGAFILPKLRRPAFAAPRLLAMLIPGALRQSMRVNADEFVNGFRGIQLSTYSATALMTVIAWVLRFWACYLLAQSLGLGIPPLYLSISITVSSLAAMLPISFLGIGPREAVLVLAFSGLGVSSEFAVAFSALNLGVTSAVLSSGAFVLIKRPIRW